MNKIKKIILKNKFLAPVALSIRYAPREIKLRRSTKKVINSIKDIDEPKIFYIGIPAHTNLGDLAQGVCIRSWLKKNYPDRRVVEIETNALVNTNFSLLKLLKKVYRPKDFIVFQSGYTTTDLGGFADEMHRAVMGILPEAKMLMLPQTIYFQKEENKKRTSQIYNSMSNMLFLARDKVSYEMAVEMFPDVTVKLYPDIVTTLIGTNHYDYKRDGVIMCCRDDGEKFYTDEEIAVLEEKCRKLGRVNRTDTTKYGSTKDIVRNAEDYIKNEIDTYAHYKVMITDRYHGTILSLVAGTPVIIIKTTDHKVTTGAEWFKGIYDDYVYLAKDLEDAYRIAEKLYSEKLDHKLNPYFEREYYDMLPALFRECVMDSN